MASHRRPDIALDELRDGEAFDVVVAGSGAAGMTAALCASLQGLKVLLVERTDLIGGTTAYSAGSAWIPNTHHSRAIGAEDSHEAASTYLRTIAGNESSEEMRQAFLRTGPEALATLEASSAVRFFAKALHPDYYSHVEGATLRGRCLEPVPFDARALGDALPLLRPGLPEFLVFGMPVDLADAEHLLRCHRSPASLAHVAKLLLRYGVDLARHGRSTRLVMGGALVGRLLLSLRQQNVPLALGTAVTRIERGASGVERVTLEQGSTRREVSIVRGLVSATGGFNRHPTLRESLMRQPTPSCPGAPGHTGAMLDLVLGIGGRLAPPRRNNGFWAPVTVKQRHDGSTAVFPLFHAHRGKPGFVIVNEAGRRFVNEALSYHPFVQALYDAHERETCLPAWLITDSVGLRKYGMGMVRPGGWAKARYIADGYLKVGATLAELGGRIGVDPVGLAETVAKLSAYAEAGKDPEFGRGDTDYQRITAGDRAHGPNPSLGRIATAPFYAVRIHPGDIGAATGLVTDAHARVLDHDGLPIPRLYACGNDMDSVMGGNYPGPGITIGPGMTFAYAASKHLAGTAA